MANAPLAPTDQRQHFIEQARAVHGDRYDYSFSDLIPPSVPVVVDVSNQPVPSSPDATVPPPSTDDLVAGVQAISL